MTTLADRFLAAERAAAERLASIERARQDLQDALAHLEMVVGADSSTAGEIPHDPPDGRFGHVAKPNGRAKPNAKNHASRRCANDRCAKPFTGRGRQKYCSRLCSKAAWDRAQRAKPSEQQESEAPSGAGP